jgi:hypothetical protein
MSDDIIEELTALFPEIPSYDKLNIRPKPLYKRDLRKLHGGFKVKGDIESAQEKFLDELWDSYKISTKDKEQYIHDSTDFFRDLELNIFSYLIVDGTSMDTAFRGGFELSLKEIHSKPTFELKLEHTFFRKVRNIDKYISQELEEAFEGDYDMLLFVFENSDFDKEIKRTEEEVMKIIEAAAPAVQNSNPKKATEGFNELIKDLRKELVGAEYQDIHDNLNKFIENLNTLLQRDLVEGLSRIKKIFESLRVNIPKSFEQIYKSRFEIIDQIKEASKRSIRLFDGIKKLHLALEEIQTKSGVKITDGTLSLNLSQIEFDDFKLIINRYRAVLSEFHSNSVIGRVQLLEFYPNKRLSFGEKSLLSFFSSLFEFTLNKHYHDRRKKNYLLLLDETDLGYHPLWKKKFVTALVEVVPLIFSHLEVGSHSNPQNIKPNIQIIITTHDPLTLSDIPISNITYLNVEGESTVVLEKDELRRSFGANITDLMADSFFIGDGLVGNFAKKKITEVVEGLKSGNKEQDEKGYYRSLINLIDEPLVNRKLSEMFDEVYNEDLSLKAINDQIIYLQTLKNKMKGNDLP